MLIYKKAQNGYLLKKLNVSFIHLTALIMCLIT